MNNISIDCDCDDNPDRPTIADIGIAASLDPVALDKFCLDRVFTLSNDENNDTNCYSGTTCEPSKMAKNA